MAGVIGDLGPNVPQNVLIMVGEKRLDHEPVIIPVPLMGVPNVLGPQRVQINVPQNAMRMAPGQRPMAERLRPMPKTAKPQHGLKLQISVVLKERNSAMGRHHAQRYGFIRVVQGVMVCPTTPIKITAGRQSANHLLAIVQRLVCTVAQQGIDKRS